MSDNNQEILVIDSFKLSAFRNLLDLNLMVDNQLMLEFAFDMVKSCSFSSSETLMKLWVVPYDKLIRYETVEDPSKIMDLDDIIERQKDSPLQPFEKFNMYILKGDLFKRYLSVFSGDVCSLEFTIQNINGTRQASLLKIYGETESKSKLVADFTLTSEEVITNKVEDYEKIIDRVTPLPDFYEFVVTEEQSREIKKMVKLLHKSIANNCAYLTFDVDCEKEIVVVSDKVFKIDLPLERTHDMRFPDKSFSFNILKSDFVISGGHQYSFYTNVENDFLVLNAVNSNCLVGCYISKVMENSDDQVQSSLVDSTLETMDLDDYFA